MGFGFRSLAVLIEALTYYVASGPEELHRVMGIDWTFGGLGYGYAVIGNPVAGEEHRHELVHILLSRTTVERPTHSLINEGLVVRYGGSMGQTFPELVTEYAGHLAARPEITLNTILEDNSPDKGWNVAGAVVVDRATRSWSRGRASGVTGPPPLALSAVDIATAHAHGGHG